MPYSDTPIVYQLAGAGGVTEFGNASTNIASTTTKTLIDKTNRVLQDGTITRVVFLTNSSSGTTKISSCKFCVWRASGNDLVPVSVETVSLSGNSTDLSSGSVTDYTLSTPIDVLEGDYVGIMATASSGQTASVRCWPTTAPVSTGETLIFNSDKTTGTITNGLTSPDASISIQPLCLSAYGVANVYTLGERPGGTGFATAKTFFIPIMPGLSGGQYAKIEGIVCPDTETVTLSFYASEQSEVAATKCFSVEINRTTDKLNWKDASNTLVRTLSLPDGTTYTADEFDLYVWWDWSTGEYMLYLYDQNKSASVTWGFGTADKLLQPVSGNTSGVDRSDFSTKTATGLASAEGFVVEVLGTANTVIGSVTGFRKPIVVVGDSIFDDSQPYVGPEIANAFSEVRHVINLAVAGTGLTSGDSGNKSIFDRFLYGANHLRDAVYLLGNGPGVNDINFVDSSEDRVEAMVAMIAGRVMDMAGRIVSGNDADNLTDFDSQYGGVNDLIMTNLLPIPDAVGFTDAEQRVRTELNKWLYLIAGLCGASFVDFTGYDGTYTTVHPTQPELLTPLIKSAYEQKLDLGGVGDERTFRRLQRIQ